MSSEVLALKYRPRGFHEVVGQETTVKILKNALTAKKFHHAYLFAGPRGIGKTTLARIFAKALNCEKGPAGEPCNDCVSCREIAGGRSLSVLEIDGASNTGVEDVRDLRDKIRYLPPGGRYKIYIMDEVHMLSTPAFNALLKTLEEPPPHAVFLFATTEPHKLLPTVLSRLIRFDLRPLPVSVIVEHLKKIAKAESIQAEEPALYLIAREADGGLRDALSLLDQTVAFSGRNVTVSSVEAVTGVSTRRFVLQLIAALLQKDPAAVLKISDEAFTSGLDLKKFALDLLEYFRHLLVVRVSREPALFDIPAEDLEELASVSKGAGMEDLDRLFQILQRGIGDLLRSPLPKVLFDVLLIRLCRFESLRPLEEILKILSGNVFARTGKAGSSLESGEILLSPETPSIDTPVHTPSKTWPAFLTFLKGKKPQLHSMIEQGRLLQLGETEVVLDFPSESIHRALLEEEDRASAMKESLYEFFGRSLTLRLAAKETSESSPSRIVDEAIHIFGAKVERRPA